MHIPFAIRHRLLNTLFRVTVERRNADVTIGDDAEKPYLRRWWVIPRNRWFNIYFHHFCRSDDDRALHCHPWRNMSILLDGAYTEVVPVDPADPSGETKNLRRLPGDIVFRRSGKMAHRILLDRSGSRSGEMIENPVWTLFITGPVYRRWGFYCPKGWVFWKDFTAPTSGSQSGRIGKGCGEDDGDKPSVPKVEGPRFEYRPARVGDYGTYEIIDTIRGCPVEFVNNEVTAQHVVKRRNDEDEREVAKIAARQEAMADIAPIPADPSADIFKSFAKTCEDTVAASVDEFYAPSVAKYRKAVRPAGADRFVIWRSVAQEGTVLVLDTHAACGEQIIDKFYGDQAERMARLLASNMNDLHRDSDGKHKFS